MIKNKLSDFLEKIIIVLFFIGYLIYYLVLAFWFVITIIVTIWQLGISPGLLMASDIQQYELICLTYPLQNCSVKRTLLGITTDKAYLGEIIDVKMEGSVRNLRDYLDDYFHVEIKKDSIPILSVAMAPETDDPYYSYTLVLKNKYEEKYFIKGSFDRSEAEKEVNLIKTIGPGKGLTYGGMNFEFFKSYGCWGIVWSLIVGFTTFSFISVRRESESSKSE